MEFNYKSFKLGFVNFFKDRGYKTYVSQENKNLVFMYSSKEEISIVQIFDSYTDKTDAKELDYLIKKLAKAKDVEKEDIKVIEIYLSNEKENYVVEKPNKFIVMSEDLKFLKLQLGKFFADINGLEINNNENVEKDINSSSKESENIEDMSDVQSSQDLEKKVKLLQRSVTTKPHPVSLLIMTLFMIIPIVGIIVGTVMGVGNSPDQISRLFQGGTNYSLTMLGGQWWRMFTYGFSTPSGNFIVAILLIILGGWSLYKMSKLNEFIMKPGKFIIAFVVSYIVLGYFSSIVTPTHVTGGIGPMLAIIVGMLALNVSGTKSLVASISKFKLIWPIILLIFIPLFGAGSMDYVSIITGFAVGGSMGFFMTYDYKELNWRLAVPVIVMLIAILLPTILILIPQYVPGEDPYIINTLAIYVQKHLLSVDGANKIIQNIGWDLNIEEVGGILFIPTV